MERKLDKVLLNQVILYKKLCKIEDKLNSRSADKDYYSELEKEREKIISSLNKDDKLSFL